MTTDPSVRSDNIHTQSALAVDMVLKTSMIRKTFDNVTLVMVCFEGFNNFIKYGKDEDYDQFHILKQQNHIIYNSQGVLPMPLSKPVVMEKENSTNKIVNPLRSAKNSHSGIRLENFKKAANFKHAVSRQPTQLNPKDLYSYIN